MLTIYEKVENMTKDQIKFNKFRNEEFETEGYTEFFAIMTRYGEFDKGGLIYVFENFFNKLWDIFEDIQDDFNESLFHSSNIVITLTCKSLINLQADECVGEMIKYLLDSDHEKRKELIDFFDNFIGSELNDDNQIIYDYILSSEYSDEFEETLERMKEYN